MRFLCFSVLGLWLVGATPGVALCLDQDGDGRPQERHIWGGQPRPTQAAAANSEQTAQEATAASAAEASASAGHAIANHGANNGADNRNTEHAAAAAFNPATALSWFASLAQNPAADRPLTVAVSLGNGHTVMVSEKAQTLAFEMAMKALPTELARNLTAQDTEQLAQIVLLAHIISLSNPEENDSFATDKTPSWTKHAMREQCKKAMHVEACAEIDALSLPLPLALENELEVERALKIGVLEGCLPRVCEINDQRAKCLKAPSGIRKSNGKEGSVSQTGTQLVLSLRTCQTLLNAQLANELAVQKSPSTQAILALRAVAIEEFTTFLDEYGEVPEEGQAEVAQRLFDDLPLQMVGLLQLMLRRAEPVKLFAPSTLSVSDRPSQDFQNLCMLPSQATPLRQTVSFTRGVYHKKPLFNTCNPCTEKGQPPVIGHAQNTLDAALTQLYQLLMDFYAPYRYPAPAQQPAP